MLAYSDPVGRHRILPTGETEIVTPGHCGGVYAILAALLLRRARGGVRVLLPDGTTLVGRAASKLTAGERGAQGVLRRLVNLGAIPPAPHADLAAWLPAALRDLGAVEFHHPGNYKFAFRIGPRRQRRRVHVAGVVDEPYPTHIAPSIAVPAGGQR
ncbi:hypothetical protein AB0H83_45825 [Dactylosporangium sp. NPDC050688]|uniref:hypothetical protein n=1 Tax=Dactylosporangium sp. NPDC050688 TaxID=3157217 RepID=UPI00340FD8C7